MTENADSRSQTRRSQTTLNDVAIFLDLDNLVIGAKQVGLSFDINLAVEHIKKITNGRIVLRHSYGDWRQSPQLMKDLAKLGFNTQSTIRLNNFSKNLADMQIVVDTMETLIDGHEYNTYVLMTGDRDFTPLAQTLRKRGKQVIGMGVKHTTSDSFVGICDQYIFYEDIVPKPTMTDTEVEALLIQAVDKLLHKESRVQASVLRQYLSEASNGAFDQTAYAEGSFSKFLKQYEHIISLEQENTTVFVQKPQKEETERPLHLRYRTSLKKRKTRVVPVEQRFYVLKDLITLLMQSEETVRWRQIIDTLSEKYEAAEKEISKNVINAVLLLAREAEIIQTHKGRSLSTAPVVLNLTGEKIYQEAIMRCDATYLQKILELPEPFDMEEAAVALYYNTKQIRYLQSIQRNYGKPDA